MAASKRPEPDNILDALTGIPATDPSPPSGRAPTPSTSDTTTAGTTTPDRRRTPLERELAGIHGVSAPLAKRLVEHFNGDRDAIADATMTALTAVEGIGPQTAQRIQEALAPATDNVLMSALAGNRRPGPDLSTYRSVKLRADACQVIATVAFHADLDQQDLLTHIVMSWANAHGDELARLGITWQPAR
jgi:hypothetical protein